MKNITMKKVLVALIAGAVLGLAGCGGSGAGAGGQPEGAQAAKDAQDVRVVLSASSRVLPSDGSAPVDLTAIVTEAESGVSIEGKEVAFAVRDPANGVRVEVTRALTDASGVAVARLLLNGNATEREVAVLASVDQKTPAELVIQVASRATSDAVENNSRGELTVRLGTDNLIEDLKEQLSYRKRYAAIVTDNAGIPRSNVTVLATLRSTRYYVGYWAAATSGGGWSQVHLVPEGIQSEDVANFGICDADEDKNNDKVLTPGNIASYTVQGQTDANGVAVLNIVYPKSFAQWAQMQLEVTASVGGTEGFSAMTIPLPILAADVTNDQVAPPSIARTRGSLKGENGVDLPIDFATEGLVNTSIVPGSPFPYLSVTPTCPVVP
jgi:hypothetical protein